MFTTLDPCPRTIACHENGPVQELRRRYLEHLATQSAAPHTIMAAAEAIYRAAIWRKLEESGPVERKDIERAAKSWLRRSKLLAKIPRLALASAKPVRTITPWLTATEDAEITEQSMGEILHT